MNDNYTFITALNEVLYEVKDSGLNEEFWVNAEKPLDYLYDKLGLTGMQAVLLAILIEIGEATTWRMFGNFISCPRMSVMAYAEELDALVKRRWVGKKFSKKHGDEFIVYDEVIEALSRGEVYEPDKCENYTVGKFISSCARLLRPFNAWGRERSDFGVNDQIGFLISANPQLPLCAYLAKADDIDRRLFIAMADYYRVNGDAGYYEGFPVYECQKYMDVEDFEWQERVEMMSDGTHSFFKEGIIEFHCDGGAADTDYAEFTGKAREELLEGLQLVPCRKKSIDTSDLRKHADIKPKEMYYNPDEKKQIDELSDLLAKEKFSKIQKRLEKAGMRKGFACLFHGAPGTGKTETVLQLARRTGRDIMQVDISEMRDKYVGESEKNLKRVFRHYRNLYENCELCPILFFNEADGVFNVRSKISSSSHSVDKMENTMQNIILQEMEDFEGILIATTNLTDNLDGAFDRRFLYKVCFRQPGADVKTSLWKSMMGNCGLDDGQFGTLASKYDFSGGQIENIARKCAVHEIMYGERFCFDEIDEICKQEKLRGGSEAGKIRGF